MTDYKTRKPTRLKGFDYSNESGNFVTICTINKICYFGSVYNNKMMLNKFGKIAESCWLELKEVFKDIVLDKFIILPNHIHGIIIISKEIRQHKDNMKFECQGLINQAPTNQISTDWILMKNKCLTLGKIIRYYKAKTSYSLKSAGLKDFSWQRNYNDHIIRGGKDYNAIQQYIHFNAIKWENDKENINPENKYK